MSDKRQLDLFDDDGHDRTYDAEYDPRAASMPKAEKRRLSKQCAWLLDELRKRGTMTNQQMVTEGGILKYTSRISDLRAAGHKVVIVKRDRKSGLTVYRLDDCVPF